MLSVNFKGQRGRFASLDHAEVRDELIKAFPDHMISGGATAIRGKRAEAVGGGVRYHLTVRAKTPIQAPNGELLYPQVLLRDQTAPGKALTLSIGFYRQVCSNGLFAFRGVSQVSVPHFKNRTQTFIYLIDQIQALLSQASLLMGEISEMAAKTIPLPIAAVESMDLPKKLKERVITAIAAKNYRQEDNPHTLWGLYNIINEIDRLTARRNSTAYLDRDQSFNLAA